MSTGPMARVVEQLRQTADPDRRADLTDGELLDCYIRDKAEGAFEALVRRHGPMVLGVCRRVLRNVHDAEDAFQATFLVLVRKAASIEPRHKLASWLYGVAYLAALKTRAATAKRRAKELEMPRPATVTEGIWHDVAPLLDQELSRLPDRYRLPLLMCDLESLTRKEAARQLGWPEGTVAGRLARARSLLAKRLTKRGVPFSAGVLAATLSHDAALASVPAPLLHATIHAAAGTTGAAGISASAAATAKGVINAMFWSKVKGVAAVILVLLALVGAGFGVLSYGASPDASVPGGDNENRAEVLGKERKPAAKGPEAADLAKRLVQLEKQVEALTREVEMLRKKTPPEPPMPPRAENKPEVRIFSVRNSDAAAVAKVLNDLFPSGPTMPARLRITTFESSILVLAMPEDLETIEAIVINLEERSRAKKPTEPKK